MMASPPWLITLKSVLRFWKSFVVVLIPIAALPLLFQGDEDDTQKAYQCAYVMIMMGCFWLTEALPLAITALLPVVLFPLLGILTTDAVGKEYLKETNLMFISGIIVAIAVEHCNLHTRIALKVLLLVGTGPRRLMFGCMVITAFFSMWISNTATTAMMVPIVTGVMDELDAEDEQFQEQERESEAKSEGPHQHMAERLRLRRVMMFLSVAYAANTGGTATLTGNGANLVLKGILASSFPTTPINFATWLGFALPCMILNIFLCWLWLQLWFMGLPKVLRKLRLKRRQSLDQDDDRQASNDRHTKVWRLLKQKYEDLGIMTLHEILVLILFVLLIFLWFFRDPGFLKGWGNYVTVQVEEFRLSDPECTSNCTYVREWVEKDSIDDATAGMIVVVLLCILPSKLNFWPFKRRQCSPSPGLLEWGVINKRMPWALVLLLGGGFALAKATQVSGFSQLLGAQLEVLDFLDRRVLVLVVCIFSTMATEVTSNVATISILLPILRDLALSLKVNPLYLMVPSTISCCYAFMLPVATPPNAIVYSASGVMKTSDMIKCGFFVNLFCLLVNYACLNTYGMAMFNLNSFPDWATDEKFRL